LKFGVAPRKLKLTVQYDGTDYVGWQRQAEGVSIQGLLEDALQRIEGAAVTVYGAGRTDAGVHALAQVASVSLTAALDPPVLVRALNAVLPRDVRVRDVEFAHSEFHARFSAKGKRYRYRILNGGSGSPFEMRYSWHVPQPLDFEAMIEAAAPLAGSHDFAAFAAAGSSVATTTRAISSVHVNRGFAAWNARGALITVDVAGDGFLRHMVRNIAGTLVDIGQGRWPAAAMQDILDSRDRARAGATAPPQGLFLVEVLYEEPEEKEERLK
jgi:tRNA pseudouridine38-40 synthase